MLYPLNTETRDVVDLSGLWKFKMEEDIVNPEVPLSQTIDIGVPGSFNEQVHDKKIANHIGYFWYENEFFINKQQLNQRNVLYFGSVAQNCEVYVNGKLIGKHIGGYTPFEFDISKFIQLGQNNLKVRVNNLLDNTTVPTASQKIEGKKIIQQNRFDFFNFAGINRPVKLYTTNFTYIESIAVNYIVKNNDALVTPDISIHGDYDDIQISIIDEDGHIVAQNDRTELTIKNVHLWQVLNSYLYQLKVDIFNQGELLDTYAQTFGVRTIEVKDHQIFINGKSVYLKGFGWHEDTIAHGGGLNLNQVVEDLRIMKDLGANSFRTSHYPYANETMQLADKLGFVVIDECPAVGLYEGFTSALTGGNAHNQNTWKDLNTLRNHKRALKEMIERDHDHPSAIIWSLANEPASMESGAHEYFMQIANYTKQLDPQKRPITIVNIMTANAKNDLVDDLVDVLCLNRYWGWYIDYNDLKQAKTDSANDLRAWHEKFPDKPIIFTEFGADTVSGLHSNSHQPYSEEYQVDYYKANFEVMDQFDFIRGEQLWNFADFVTDPSLIRIGSRNMKGCFTRDRHPKEIVSYLKQRWLK